MHVSRIVSSCFATLRQLRMQHSSVDVISGTTVAGRLAGAVAPGLWQRDARRGLYLATSSTDYSLWWTPLHDLFALRGSTSTSPRYSVTFTGCGCQSGERIEFKLSVLVFRCLHGIRLCRTWRTSYVVWRTWIQERGCDLRRRLPLSHHLRIVRRLVAARSSSLRRVPGTLPSSVTASETLGSRHLQASSENASFCHVIPLIFFQTAHIGFCFVFLTSKSVLEVIFRLYLWHFNNIRLIIIIIIIITARAPCSMQEHER